MFVYLGIATSKQEVLIHRQYRRDINFRSFQQCVDLVVKDQQNGSSPVTTLEDGCIFHITCDKLHYLLCSTKAVGDESTVSAVVAVAFLEEFHRVIKDFCGSASEDGVRRNLLLLEEIMAEVINHGHIYTTELSSLRPCVYSEAAEVTHPRNASMLSSLASQVQEQKGLMPNAASVRPVFAPRSDRQHRQRGDIFVDVIEKLFATISKEGKLLNFQLDGTVNLRSCLESQVDVTLGLNENLVLADSALQAASYSTDVVLSSYIIHDSVNMDSFSEHRTLVVRSPQGEVPVLRYQTTDLPHNGLPFTITTAVEEVSNSRDLELTVRLRCEGNPASEAIDTTVQIPVPSGTTGLMKRFNELEQTVEFQRESRKLVWRIKRLQAKSEALAKFRLTNANEGGSSKLQLGPMALKFELSNQSSSGLKIRFLRLSRATDAQRWIRYVTTSDSWVQRLT
ncbi:unnamed protein product [Ixodes pacificus]